MPPVRGNPVGPSLLPVLAALLVGCGSSAATLAPSATPTATPLLTIAPAATTQSPETAAPQTAEPSAAGGMQIRFANLTDGGTVSAATNKNGKAVVTVQVEVTGGVAFDVSLQANGQLAVDEGGRQLDAQNAGGKVPFDAEFAWLPPNGGGDYTLVATAMDEMKDFATATIHVTVTGAAHVTLPPALTEAQARARVTQLIQQQYKVTVPKPSLQRFDFPQNPTRSRWIGAAYYNGFRYYVSIFDDGHVEWANGPYADPAHRRADVFWCRPAGTFKVLVVFVDYGNTGVARAEALADVPVVTTWLDQLYTAFATSQGLSQPLMTVAADAAWVSSPPAVNQLLTADQIRTLGGRDPSAYDFTMQIDLDVNGGWGVANGNGAMEPGGGFALNGCGTLSKYGPISIWSSVATPGDLEGGLRMDFDHELSHLFGMVDDYPYRSAVTGPDGRRFDDWIPYVQFGWSDTDGDGIPEIVDPTPYGTAGPKP